MGLLSEDFIETYELELIGSDDRYAYVYWPQTLHISDNDWRANRLARKIIQLFLRTPIVAFPSSFMDQFQDTIMNEGWWIMFDEKTYNLPIEREYFEITRFHDMNLRPNDNAFIVRWGGEEICQIVLPFNLFPEFETLKVKSKYYAVEF